MNTTCEKCGKTKAEHYTPMEYCYEFGPIKQRFTPALDAEKPEWRELGMETNLFCWDCAGNHWKDAIGGSQGPCQRCGRETYLREFRRRVSQSVVNSNLVTDGPLTESNARKVAESEMQIGATHYCEKCEREIYPSNQCVCQPVGEKEEDEHKWPAPIKHKDCNPQYPIPFVCSQHEWPYGSQDQGGPYCVWCEVLRNEQGEKLNQSLQSQLSSATERAEKAESKARDQQCTFEFGGRVMNQLVLTRVNEIIARELAFDALERWLKERDQFRAQVETLNGDIVFYKKCLATIAEEFGVTSPVLLIATAEKGETYFDVLMKWIRAERAKDRSAKSAINQTSEGGR